MEEIDLILPEDFKKRLLSLDVGERMRFNIEDFKTIVLERVEDKFKNGKGKSRRN